MIFGRGYAAKRNAVLYNAIKHNMDYLIFLDDDEYPMAVTKNRNTTIWGGQHVLLEHLKYITQADITHGHHCGYISPIPYMEFNDTMTEADFRSFIEAISNDIVNWDTLKTVIKNGGVTYADTNILTSDEAVEVQETNRAKFISGANLCINLTDPRRIFPFYNPPGARGEDTFLSTCLSERKVLRVPCYTFHDGFSTYNHLLAGVLPIRLRFIKADTEQITTRFYKACIGWIRYKPLLLYITQPDRYEEKIQKMREQLTMTLPKICAYFEQPDFMKVLAELEKYNRNVEKHYCEFRETQRIWAKIMEHFADHR
jgi:glycosyltransferase involved in cell wall biosynthesis